MPASLRNLIKHRLLAVSLAALTGGFLPRAPLCAETANAVFAEVDRTLERISSLTGLQVQRPVEYASLSREEIRSLVEQRLKEETQPEEIRLEELFLKSFGLVGPDFDLSAQLVDVLSEQAAALYDFKTRKLYLAEWAAEDLQEVALIHELVHALQDQHFNLGRFIAGSKTADADLARTAVIEGQASWIMTELVLNEGGRSLLGDPLMATLTASASRFEAEKYPIYASSPLYIQETLLFPYTQGLLFQQEVLQRLRERGYAAVFERPPVSSQNILEPETYFQSRRPQKPKPPKAKLGGGYRKAAAGDIGQLDHFVLLKKYAGEEVAEVLAPEWRGGRYVLREDRDSGATALSYASQWRSAETAQEFFEAYGRALERKWSGVEFLRDEESLLVGTSEAGAFVTRRDGTLVTSLEGIPNDKLESHLPKRRKSPETASR